VVEKQTVAKERIGIEKTVETEQQTVSDAVRKERVDVDDDQ
jgi:stress response protein YsnF